MISSRSLGAATLLALLGSAPAFAAAYVGSAYEGFDYTAGNMTNTLNGGTGWNATGDAGAANSSNWGTGTNLTLGGTAANQALQSVGLTYGGLQTTGGSVLITGNGQAGRSLGQSVNSGTFYFSYLVQKTMDQVRTVNFSFFGTNERLSIGQIANNVNLKNPDGTPDPDALTKANQGEFVVLASNPQGSVGTAGIYTSASPISFDVNETFLIVGKIEFNVSGTADRLSLYINPDSLFLEPSEAYITLDGIDYGELTGFRMFAGGNQTNQTVGTQTGLTFAPSAAKFDEIRFGNTYASVVNAIPEPSSFAALAGLGGLAFAALRRRRA